MSLATGAVAFVVLLHTQFGVPLAKIATVLRVQFGLTVTAGGLAQVLHRTAQRAAPIYAELCDQVRGSPVVTPDETGWRVGAVPHWLWVFATPDTTVYAIRPGRSFDDAATILREDFAGVLVRDGWAAYRSFTEALHQTCVAHLLRRCRTLQADHPRSPWAAAVQQVLQEGLALRDRRDVEAISSHGLTVARGQLLARLATAIETAPTWPDAQRFAKHLQTEYAAVFAFLWVPEADATNWRAEQAIRPAVVTRKVCGGNRTDRGAKTQEILATVVRTATQRDTDLASLFTTLLRSVAIYPADRAGRLRTPRVRSPANKRRRLGLTSVSDSPQDSPAMLGRGTPEGRRIDWKKRLDAGEAGSACSGMDYHCSWDAGPGGITFNCNPSVDCDMVRDCLRESCDPNGFTWWCAYPGGLYGGAFGVYACLS